MRWTPDILLSAPFAASMDVADWRAQLDRFADPFSLAVLATRSCPSPGWAFACGYQAALRALLPAQMAGRVGALCATEAGGNHPRSIQTTLQDGVLNGEKTFVTLGEHAEVLLVVARTGTDSAGRPTLVACVVDSSAPGVRLEAGVPLPMVPEVPHAGLKLVDVRPVEVLPGDGYTRVLKRFRTVEDIHVHAALSAWLVGVAQHSEWPDTVVEALLAVIGALDLAARLDPSAPGTHRLLGGALAELHAILERHEALWAATPEPLRMMWARDRVLMRVAGGARKTRLERARAVVPSVDRSAHAP